MTSVVAKEIAATFQSGALTVANISPRSISELGTTYLGKPVLVTWYPGGFGPRRLRTISVDGTEGVFPDGADAKLIFKAALSRADRLIDAKMAELEGLRQRAMPVQEEV